MQSIQDARAWLAVINPALPAVVLVIALWAPQAAIRRWLPRLWELPASWGPKAQGLRQAWQALPSLAGGALLGALSTGGDPWEAAWGAVAAACTPFLHHVLKAIPFVPYQGELGGKRDKDDDKTPPDGTKPVGPVLMVLVALTVAGCAGLKPAARTTHEAAKILCELFFSQRDGISVEEAARTACATEEQLRPWIDEALAAQQAAGAAAPPSKP